MDYIYARVSTSDQTTDSQTVELSALYPDAIIMEEIIGGAKQKPVLSHLLTLLNTNDRLIVYSLDRLGRRASPLISLLEDLESRGIIFISKREGIDYSTAVGRLVLQVLAAVAELEREMISERVTSGLVAAKARGKRLGRPSEIKQSAIDQAFALVDLGKTITSAAKACGMSQPYLSRLLRKRALEKRLLDSESA